MTEATRDDQPMSFDGQRPGEKVLFVFRRHFIVMRQGLYLFVIPLLLTSVPPLIWNHQIELFILPLIGLGMGLILFSYHFILWYFSIYIVTNDRIRQVTQKSLFGREVIDLRLSKVQSISYNIPGFTADIFHFGTIIIHTFVGDLVVHHVERPVEIYNKLQDAVGNVATKGDYEETDK